MTEATLIVCALAWAAMPAMLWHRVPWRRAPARTGGRVYFLVRDTVVVLALLSLPAMTRMTEVPGPRGLLPLWVVIGPFIVGWVLSRPRPATTRTRREQS